MKTIAYVVAGFPVFSETFVGTEIRAMEKLGHDIALFPFYRGKSGQPWDITLASNAIYLNEYRYPPLWKVLPALSTRAVDALKFAVAQKSLSVRSLLYNSIKLAALAEEAGCSHFHAHFASGAAAHAIVAARMTGKTVSFVSHGFDVYQTPRDLALKLGNANFAVAVCSDMVNDLRAISPQATIHEVYCGVESERFKFHSVGEKNGKLIYWGRLTEQKGLDDLLEAIRLLSDGRKVEIDIVGDGESRQELQEMVESYGLQVNVNFLGRKDAEWIIENAGDYLALVAPFKKAKSGANDTGPVVLKEAMAMGLPVVTTSLMGCKDIVVKEVGFMGSPGDPDSLAANIECLLNLSREERDRMGANGRKRLEKHFSSIVQARKLSALIEEL